LRKKVGGSAPLHRRHRAAVADLESSVVFGACPSRYATKKTASFFCEPLPRSIKLRYSEGAALDLGPMVLRLLSSRWLLRRQRRQAGSDGQDTEIPRVLFVIAFLLGSFV
jgi:hypothetical protein